MYVDLANVELAAGASDKAIAVVRRGLVAIDRNPDLLWVLANLLIDTNDLKAARTTKDVLGDINYPRSLLALLNFANRNGPRTLVRGLSRL